MYCNGCGSSKVNKIRDYVRYNIPIKVYQCRECGLQFLGEHKKLDYNKSYRKKYSPILGKPCDSEELFDIYSRFQDYKIKDLTKHINIKDKTLLDVGCASGYFVEAIKPYVAESYGLELRKKDVDFAKKRGLDVRRNLSDFDRYQFDVITMFHTLEHMEDPLSFLSYLKPYMRKGSKIYISVPNLDDVMLSVYGLEEYADWWYEEPHLYYFNSKSLLTMLFIAGYKGDIHTQQRVNFLNHMHWLYTRKQQEKEEERMSAPFIAKNEKLNMFIQDIDMKYKKLLEENYIADNLVFVGEKI